MPFSSLIETVNITSLADGEAELLDRVPAEADTGWDSMRDTWLIRSDAAGLDPMAALGAFAALNRGTQVSGFNMWIQSRSARCRARGIFVAEVVSQGLLSARGYKVRYDSGANQQSGENIAVPGEGIKSKLSTDESQVTADLEYIIIGGLAPGNPNFLTAKVGLALDPPSTWKPAVKASIWTSLVDPTFHYPYGWVLKSAQMENLPGLDTVWLARERYQYVYPFSP